MRFGRERRTGREVGRGRETALQPDGPTLRIERDHVALAAGDSVPGVLVLRLPAPARLSSVWVAAAGRELLHPANRYAPFVYTTPVPRPWGRSQTGALRLDYRTLQPLLGPAPAATVVVGGAVAAPGEWPAGEHAWPFRLPIPPEALPTYGGIHALLEHELEARAIVDGRPLQAWQPLHVWQPGRSVDGRPVTLRAPDTPTRPWQRWVASLRAPVRLTLRLPSEYLDLWQPLSGTLTLENPEQVALGPLTLELVGTERVRHMSATDHQELVAARWQLRLGARPRVSQTFSVSLPRTLAPTLHTPRFRLDWRLRAMVTVPWGLGVCGTVKVVLRDGGGRRVTEEAKALTGAEER